MNIGKWIYLKTLLIGIVSDLVILLTGKHTVGILLKEAPAILWGFVLALFYLVLLCLVDVSSKPLFF